MRRNITVCPLPEWSGNSACRQLVVLNVRAAPSIVVIWHSAPTPEPPVADWLAAIHDEAKGAKNFFAGRAVVLDLSLTTLSTAAVGHLIRELDRILVFG